MAFLTEAANRGSISTGYDIDYSVKLEDANDEYFTRTNASGTNRRTWTVSLWCKRTKLSTADGLTMELWDGGVHSEATRIGFGLNNDEIWYDIGYSVKYRGQTTNQYTDTSAWYHIVWKVDTTQSTEADRMRLYVNGEEVTEWVSRQYPPQNFDSAVHAGTLARIGSYDATYHGFHGYIAEFNYLDGLAVAPTEFGETDEDTGIWKPKAYSGSYPGQSCYLDFSDSSNLGSNAKGDDADWTANNLTSADQATDTPTNNFAINNIVDGGSYTADNVSYKEGGTVQVRNQNTNYNYNFSTLGMTKGKWYAEFQRGSATNIMIGVQLQNFDSTLSSRVNTYIGMGADNHGGAFAATGHYYYNNGATSEGTTYSDSQILGVAVDCDNNKIYFSVNGTYVNSGNPASGSNGFDFGPLDTNEPCFFVMNSRDPNKEHKANFGGFTTISISSAASDANGYGTFEYAPPSGYYALCTKNLAEYG